MKKKNSKLKRLLPSLRENKRYLAFNIISKGKITSYEAVKQEISNNLANYIGALGMAKAGIQFINYKDNKGIIRINNKYLNHLRASFCFIDKINNDEVIVRSTKASGILNKVK